MDVEEGCLEIHIKEAAALPDTAAEASCGFLQHFASGASGKQVCVTQERVKHDFIRISMMTG